jgi:hypothetical protein
VEFLCDIALSDLPIDQFIGRKENVKRIFRAWRNIFRKVQPEGKGDLRLLTRHDLSSAIYEELLLFNSNVVGRGYERAFPSYRQEQFNIEAVLMIDARQTILDHCPRDITDYLLRGGFPAIIDFQPEYIEMHLQRKKEEGEWRKEEDDIIYVLLDGEKAKAEDYPRLSLNLKWFAGVLGAVAFVFGKWAH